MLDSPLDRRCIDYARFAYENWFSDVCGIRGGLEISYLFVNAHAFRRTGERIAEEERVKRFVENEGFSVLGYGIFPPPEDSELDASTFAIAVDCCHVDREELTRRLYDLMDFHPVRWDQKPDDDDEVRLDLPD